MLKIIILSVVFPLTEGKTFFFYVDHHTVTPSVVILVNTEKIDSILGQKEEENFFERGKIIFNANMPVVERDLSLIITNQDPFLVFSDPDYFYANNPKVKKVKFKDQNKFYTKKFLSKKPLYCRKMLYR